MSKISQHVIELEERGEYEPPQEKLPPDYLAFLDEQEAEGREHQMKEDTDASTNSQ